MIDSHTHLDHLDRIPELGGADAVIERALATGVHGMISIGCGADSIRTTLEIARRHAACVRIAAGVHPLSAAEFDMSTFDEIAELARDPLVVAIGETGFDQFHDAGTLEQQMPAFVAQCELARELDLPLVIHSRAAEAHTIASLDTYASDLSVILHCFALSAPEDLAVVLEHDSWVCSFAGNVTYASAQDLRDAAAQMPAHRIMVETDAPYLSPKPHRGKRNEPAYVQHTLQVVADARGESFDAARAATVATASRVYGWTPAAVVTST